MGKNHIVWISDFDVKGSGYFTISVPMCTELTNRGYEIKAIGLGYKRQEHFYNFSLVPLDSFNDSTALQDSYSMLTNLITLWGVDYVVVALDIPLQRALLSRINERKYKYIGITPIESTPLYPSWITPLLQMDKLFVISKFGTEEVARYGVNATYLPVGIDTNQWRLPSDDERKVVRQSFGIGEDTFTVLTVADNQERKNLYAALKIFSGFSRGKNAKYIIVTRQNLPVGWMLWDLAAELRIADKLIILERGLSNEELRNVYATADAFMLTSKVEGLGLPLLEAMGMKIPCIATNSTGMKELLSNGRGILLDVDFYDYRDPFGGGYRYFVSIEDGIRQLDYLYYSKLYHHNERTQAMIDTAYNYVQQLSWEKSVDIFEEQLRILAQNEK